MKLILLNKPKSHVYSKPDKIHRQSNKYCPGSFFYYSLVYFTSTLIFFNSPVKVPTTRRGMLLPMAKTNISSIPKTTLSFIAEYVRTDNVTGSVQGDAAIPNGIPEEMLQGCRFLLLDLFLKNCNWG